MASVSSLLVGAAFLLVAAVYLHRYDGAGGNRDPTTSITTTTHLHFFMHDDYTGPHPTAARVVAGRSLLPTPSRDDDNGVNDEHSTTSSRSTLSLLTSPRQFGDIVALNNALTDGPSGDSKRIGTAQGFAIRVSEGGIVSHLTLHLVIEAGEHNGSSVTANGRIDMDAKVRESVVIGGTGRFRFARGYKLTQNYDYDLARGGVVEIDVYVQH